MVGESTIVGFPHRLPAGAITPLVGWVMAPSVGLSWRLDLAWLFRIQLTQSSSGNLSIGDVVSSQLPTLTTTTSPTYIISGATSVCPPWGRSIVTSHDPSALVSLFPNATADTNSYHNAQHRPPKHVAWLRFTHYIWNLIRFNFGYTFMVGIFHHSLCIRFHMKCVVTTESPTTLRHHSLAQ